jgi:SAM-dependent methyltransferase
VTDPLDQYKASSRESWGKAEDYSLLARKLEPAAVELVAACGIGPGMRVLDVAAGNGNAALAAARAGASVIASDFAPSQVELGRARTAEEGLDVEWVEADAEQLPFDDASFDCVVSVFGAQFPPRPDRVASELFRVLRPGGTVGMANWPDHGFQAEFFAVVRRHSPPEPEEVPRSALWGEEEVVRERLGEFAESIDVEPRVLPWRFETWAEMGEVFQRGAPRGAALNESLTDEQRQQLAIDFAELINAHNTATGDSIAIDADYTQVVARKKT